MIYIFDQENTDKFSSTDDQEIHRSSLVKDKSNSFLKFKY